MTPSPEPVKDSASDPRVDPRIRAVVGMLSLGAADDVASREERRSPTSPAPSDALQGFARSV